MDKHEQDEVKTEAVEATAAPEEESAPATLPLEAAWRAFLAALSEEDRTTVGMLLTSLAEAAKEHRDRAAAAEEAALLSEMEKEEAFAGITERRDALRALIEKIGWVRALPPRERLSAALYLDRGMRLSDPSPEEKLSAVLADPALLRALAAHRAKDREAACAAQPPTAGGAHSARMPANLPKTPLDLAEAGEAAKHYFKIRK